MDNQVSLVGEYLSGDDPHDRKDEMFDVCGGAGRASANFTSIRTDGTAGRSLSSTIFCGGPSWSFVPAKGTTVSLTYNAWFAPESVPTRTLNPALFSAMVTSREFRPLWVKRQFSKHLSGQVWAEVLREGNYYARGIF